MNVAPGFTVFGATIATVLWSAATAVGGMAIMQAVTARDAVSRGTGFTIDS